MTDHHGTLNESGHVSMAASRIGGISGMDRSPYRITTIGGEGSDLGGSPRTSRAGTTSQVDFENSVSKVLEWSIWVLHAGRH